MKTYTTIILLLTFLISSKLTACECTIPKDLTSVQTNEFENSDCIFVGEVIVLDSEKGTFKVKVAESFNGDKKGEIYNGIYNFTCEPIINKKGKWLIYGNINEDGFLEISLCGLTRSFTNPENNLQIFILGTDLMTDRETEKQKKERIKKAKSDLSNEIKLLRTKIKANCQQRDITYKI
jgi:hypothetical protein